MTRQLRIICWICYSFLFTTCVASSGFAGEAAKPSAVSDSGGEPTRQVRELMHEGAVKFAAGDWEGARFAYFKAWDLKRHPALAANMAAAEIKLELYREAAEHLKYALKFIPLVQTDKRDAVQEQLNECRAHLTALTIATNVAGANVTVDTVRVGPSPITDEVLVSPGKHKIEASRHGYQFASREVSTDAGQALSVSIELQPESQVPESASRAPAPVSPESHGKVSARTWALVGGGVATAVSLGVAVVYRLKSNGDANDADSLQSQLVASSTAPGGACTGSSRSSLCNSLQDKLDAFDRERNVSTGAFVASGVLGIATLATALIWPNSHSTPQQASGSIHLGPWSTGNSHGFKASVEF